MAGHQFFNIRVFFMLIQLFVATATNCGRESSVYGMMLCGHTFKTLHAEDLLECMQQCDGDVKCQSVNYVISNDICELNNRTREARPEDFVSNADRLYVKRWKKRGINNFINDKCLGSLTFICNYIKQNRCDTVFMSR